MKNIVNVGTHVSAPSPPSVFVSWHGYPKVEISPVFSLEDPTVSDSPTAWLNMDIDTIIRIRSYTLRPYYRLSVSTARDPPRPLLNLHDGLLCKEPVKGEAILQRRPNMRIEFGHEIAPIGPKAPAKKAELESGTADKRVEKTYYDDMLAEDAIWYLYREGIDPHRIANYLSAGMLGESRRRRLVPTRWAITAVDSAICKRMMAQVKQFSLISSFLLFHSALFDNHFYIIFAPAPWSFELLEAWCPGSLWATSSTPIIVSDWEGFKGRKDYASNVGGSYYASRLAVLEKLVEMKRQAMAIILREVQEGYYAPLGVWQVRENVRHALKTKPHVFDDLRELLNHIHLRIPIEQWIKHSVLLQRLLYQQSLL